MAKNMALHKNGVEFCQKLNFNISFHLTSQETDVRLRTVSVKLLTNLSFLGISKSQDISPRLLE